MTRDEVVSLKYMEELVQERDAMCVAEIWPPNRAMWMLKPPTQCAITWILVLGPFISRIREITRTNDEQKMVTFSCDSVVGGTFKGNVLTCGNIELSNIFNCEIV